MKENIDDYHKKLKNDIASKVSNNPVSDYAKGDVIYTITGLPVIFISDLLPDKKTKEQRALVKDTDEDHEFSILLKNLTPGKPSKKIALGFIATKCRSYEEFLERAANKGYDESDGLKLIWNSRHSLHETGGSSLLLKNILYSQIKK